VALKTSLTAFGTGEPAPEPDQSRLDAPGAIGHHLAQGSAVMARQSSLGIARPGL